MTKLLVAHVLVYILELHINEQMNICIYIHIYVIPMVTTIPTNPRFCTDAGDWRYMRIISQGLYNNRKSMESMGKHRKMVVEWDFMGFTLW